jgi:heptosyltransferase-2
VSDDSRWTARLAGAPEIRRALIMKWSAMGDVALSSAAIEDVRAALPHARLDLDTLPRFAGLFEHDPRFENVLAIDVRSAMLGGMVRWLARVARTRYDAIFDFQSNDRSRLLLAALVLSGRAPRLRVGIHRQWPYTIAPPAPAGAVHALQLLRSSLDAAGIPPVAERPVLYPGPDHRAKTGVLMHELGLAAGCFALLMPGCQASGTLKRWGWRRFVALALSLATRGIPKVLLVGAEDEREECDAIAAACPQVAVNACGLTSMLDLIPLAEASRCVISNDTGTAHVAAVAARPMVIVCGPTDPRRVKPAGSDVRTLQAELWCRNCYRKHCSHHSCMEVLAPERVLAALDEMGVFAARA